jgi:hypothetical protein
MMDARFRHQDETRAGAMRGPAADDPLESTDPLRLAIGALADTPPEADLWPGIEARLRRPAGGARSITITLPQLALAATLLMAVSAGVSWLALRPAAPPAETPIRAVADPIEPARGDVARATFADAQYDAAVADLERILQEDGSRLDPQTVLVIERNLRAIDEAIRQSRAALDADPANTYLNSHLADARRRKIELLRRAAGLSSGGD